MRWNPDAAKAYQKKMTEGPVTEEDVAGHHHLLNNAKELKLALRRVRDLLYGAHLQEYDEIVAPLDVFLGVSMVPVALIPKPKPKGPGMLKLPGRHNPRRKNPRLAVYRHPIWNLDKRHNYVLVMPGRKSVWATFQASSLKEAMQVAKSMRAETSHTVKLMALP
jgi:hypothetical protein